MIYKISPSLKCIVAKITSIFLKTNPDNFSIVVISGPNLPPPTKGEDTVGLARKLMDELTGHKPIQSDFKNCHRCGLGGKMILVEFLYTGMVSPLARVLNPQHRAKFYERGIFLNIHQPYHDRRLLFVARKMRKEGLITKAFANLQATTIVVTKDGRKHLIRNMDDLQNLTTTDVREFLTAKPMDTDSGLDDIQS